MRLIDADKINPSDVIGGNNDFASDIRKAMQDLIDIQPTACENGWIPCSEALPDTGNYGYIEAIVTIKGAIESTCLTYHKEGNQWMDENGEVYQVVAWKPLPDAYKPKGE